MNKIKELKEQGLSIRAIAEKLNIGRDKVHRVLKSDTSINNNRTEENNTIQQSNTPTKYNLNWKKGEKLLKEHYTKEELKAFSEAPYFE